jgi:hypothetical protein
MKAGDTVKIIRVGSNLPQELLHSHVEIVGLTISGYVIMAPNSVCWHAVNCEHSYNSAHGILIKELEEPSDIVPILETEELTQVEKRIIRCSVCNSRENVTAIKLGASVNGNSFTNVIRLCRHCRQKLSEELKK